MWAKQQKIVTRITTGSNIWRYTEDAEIQNVMNFVKNEAKKQSMAVNSKMVCVSIFSCLGYIPSKVVSFLVRQ